MLDVSIQIVHLVVPNHLQSVQHAKRISNSMHQESVNAQMVSNLMLRQKLVTASLLILKLETNVTPASLIA